MLAAERPQGPGAGRDHRAAEAESHAPVKAGIVTGTGRPETEPVRRLPPVEPPHRPAERHQLSRLSPRAPRNPPAVMVEEHAERRLPPHFRPESEPLPVPPVQVLAHQYPDLAAGQDVERVLAGRLQDRTAVQRHGGHEVQDRQRRGEGGTEVSG